MNDLILSLVAPVPSHKCMPKKSTALQRLQILTVSVFLGLSGCQKTETKEDSQRHLLVAESYIQQGQLRAANLEARNALKIDPESGAAHYTLGLTMAKAGDQANAEKHFKQAVVAQPTELKYWYALANAQVKRNQPEKASASLANIAKEASETSAYQQILGDILFLNNSLEEAEEAYRKSISKDPQQALAMLGLARLAAANKASEQAQDWLNQAAESDPDDVSVLLFKGEFNFGMGNFQIAESAFTAALSRLSQLDVMSSQKFHALDGMVRTLTASGRSLEAEQYSKILSSSPQGKLRATLNEALSAYQSGDINGAELSFESLLDRMPEHNISSTALGAIKFSKGDFAAAEAHLSAALDGSDKVGEQTYKLLSISQLRLNKPASARDILLNALEHYPNSPELKTLLGLTYSHENQLDLAKEHFASAMTADPKNLSSRLSLAALHLRSQEWNEAKAYFVESASIDPNNFVAFQGWIRVLHANQGVEQGLPELIAFSKQHPQAYGPLTAIGSAYMGIGDLSSALKYAHKAEGISKDQKQVKQLLATAYFRQAKLLSQEQKLAAALSAIKKSRQYIDSYWQSLAIEVHLVKALEGSKPALAIAETYVAAYPEVAAGYAVQGDIYVQEQNWTAASQTYSQAWEHLKNQGIGLKLLQSNMKSNNPRPEKHLLDWHQALSQEANPNKKQQLEASKLAVALAYQALNNEKESTIYYESLIEMNPENAIYLNNLAWLYYQAKNPEALTLAEKAFNLKPDVPQIADTYGWILVETGQVKQGIQVLEKAKKQWPENTDIKSHLALAKEK